MLAALVLQNGDHFAPPPAPVQATAVLLQQNLNVNQDNSWPGAEYDEHMSQFIKLSTRTCGPYLAGMPELNAYPVTPDCPVAPVTPDIILWPESPAPFLDKDARLLAALRTLALTMHAPVIAGTTSLDPHGPASTCTTPLSSWVSMALSWPLRQDPPGSVGRVHTVQALFFLRQEPHPAGRRHDPWMAPHRL
jgi:apolipoprotein N-acyltransferase